MAKLGNPDEVNIKLLLSVIADLQKRIEVLERSSVSNKKLEARLKTLGLNT
jgi:hypothetical protein